MKHIKERCHVSAITTGNAQMLCRSSHQAAEKPAVKPKLINMPYLRDIASSMGGLFKLSAKHATSPFATQRHLTRSGLVALLMSGACMADAEPFTASLAGKGHAS